MELYYQIALTNVPFDNSYKNVLHFEDRSEQETYFNVSSLFSSSTTKTNFAVGSLYATNVCFDTTADSINEMLSKNYCIVKDLSPNKTLSYYYYFITDARQDCENRLLLSLELDIFQTYYIDITFGDCMINKAHLNRFVEKVGDTSKVLFDASLNSKLFEREDIQNVAKRMTKRTKVSLYRDNDTGNWFDANIQNWVYIYVAPFTTAEHTTINATQMLKTDEALSNTLTFADITAGTGSTSCSPIPIRISGEAGRLPSGISVFCYPVYKSSYKIIFQNSHIKGGLNGDQQYDVIWGDTSQSSATYDYQTVLERFQKSNNGACYIYAVKVSTMPPFDPANLPTLNVNTTNQNCVISLSDSQVISTGSSHFLINPLIQSSGSANGVGIYGLSYDNGLNTKQYFGISEIEFQTKEIKQSVYTVSKDYEFSKSAIIGADKDVRFNPKLNSNDYFEIKISDSGEDGFVYDYQKLQKKSFYIKYSESLTPDLSKKYIRVDTDNYYLNVYHRDCDKNLIGFVDSNDNSLILSTTQYQQMLATNKNYFLQNSINRSANIGKSITGILGGIAGGAISGGTSGAIIGGIGSAIRTGIDYEQSRMQEKLTVDNMIASPASVRGAKGNVIFDNMFSENGIIVEEWNILPNEQEMINDYMCMFGYTYNRIDNIKNVDNIRKYYNYIRADVETITGTTVNISERVHLKFKEIFARGVRFWNTDTFSYAKENYERWLET